MILVAEIDDVIIRRTIEQAKLAYWCEVLVWKPDDFQLTILEHDGPHIVLTKEHFEGALGTMLRRYPRQLADMVATHGLKASGDVLVQCAAFGGMKYE